MTVESNYGKGIAYNVLMLMTDEIRRSSTGAPSSREILLGYTRS